jgi:NADH:ubiquinone oxidoreductase subunit F (NADH-binding)
MAPWREPLKWNPSDIVAEITSSGLRGRGGAGFPTGRKWEMAGPGRIRRQRQYVICNADEGDPGAYMDRTMLESNPHQVIEGMLICAQGRGCFARGIVYVRAEYPLAVDIVTPPLNRPEAGLLGEHILGSGVRISISRPFKDPVPSCAAKKPP